MEEKEVDAKKKKEKKKWSHDNRIGILCWVFSLVGASGLQSHLLLPVDRLLRNACTTELFRLRGLTRRLYVTSATVCSAAPQTQDRVKNS